MSNKSENIKSRILSPMILVGAVLILVSLTGGYRLQKNAIDNSVHQRISGGYSLFKGLLQEEIKVMSGQIDFLKTDQTLLASFLVGDRSILAYKARSFFERMHSKYRITHFYFHETDKTCFLRVHSPNRHGDLIDRFTIAGAVSTGKPYHGIELGPLGTFTLRVVHPWIVDDKLVGYIELGMEIEHISQFIKQALNLELLVLIEKKFLERNKWEDGLKILGRKGNWDLFPDFVIIDQTIEGSVVLNEIIGSHQNQNDHDSIFSVELTNRHYKGQFKDLTDVGGRSVGDFIFLMDITVQHTDLVKLTLIITGLFLVIGGGLFLFFNRYIGGIQTRLITSRKKLQSEIKVRHQSEEALTRSEKRFRSIFEASKDAIISMDKEGILQMVNPAGMELLNLTDPDLGLINFRDLYVDSAMHRSFLAKIHKQGFIRDFGTQLQTKDNKNMDCLMTFTTKLSDDGELINYEGIVRDVTPFKIMEEELRRLATKDPLTGINNRRNFLDLAQIEMNRSKRYEHPFSLIMLDIDHFKNVNDTYGHSAGDEVLKEFCGICLKAIRESDIMGRLGGEEFVVALMECDKNAVMIMAERIRKAIASHKMLIGSEEIRITTSVGVAQAQPDCDLKSMLERADRALYQAKEKGRNQVKFAS